MFFSVYELFYDGSLFEIDFFFSFNFLIFFLFIILYFFLYIFIEFYYLFGTFDIFLYGSFSTIFNFDYNFFQFNLLEHYIYGTTIYPIEWLAFGDFFGGEDGSLFGYIFDFFGFFNNSFYIGGYYYEQLSDVEGFSLEELYISIMLEFNGNVSLSVSEESKSFFFNNYIFDSFEDFVVDQYYTSVMSEILTRPLLGILGLDYYLGGNFFFFIHEDYELFYGNISVEIIYNKLLNYPINFFFYFFKLNKIFLDNFFLFYVVILSLVPYFFFILFIFFLIIYLNNLIFFSFFLKYDSIYFILELFFFFLLMESGNFLVSKINHALIFSIVGSISIFILFSNLFGLISMGGTLTLSFFSIVLLLSFVFCTFFIILFIKGGQSFLLIFLSGDIPFVLMIGIFFLEILSYVVGCFAMPLGVFANVFAGHILLHLIISCFFFSFNFLYNNILVDLFLMEGVYYYFIEIYRLTSFPEYNLFFFISEIWELVDYSNKDYFNLMAFNELNIFLLKYSFFKGLGFKQFFLNFFFIFVFFLFIFSFFYFFKFLLFILLCFLVPFLIIFLELIFVLIQSYILTILLLLFVGDVEFIRVNNVLNKYWLISNNLQNSYIIN